MGQMNLTQYRNGVRRDADKLHDQAQEEGSALLYDRAADLYEQIGDFEVSERCRKAAARLRAIDEAGA